MLKLVLNKDIIAIPRGPQREHLQANLDLFTWELRAEDQAAIDAIKTVERYVARLGQVGRGLRSPTLVGTAGAPA